MDFLFFPAVSRMIRSPLDDQFERREVLRQGTLSVEFSQGIPGALDCLLAFFWDWADRPGRLGRRHCFRFVVFIRSAGWAQPAGPDPGSRPRPDDCL
jgi:hypothetical protein